MSLRRRILAVYVVTIIVLALAGYLAARLIVLGSFADLEARITQQNVERVLNALANDISDLDTFASDWAAWDDSYAFIEDRNADYIRSNLVDETFTNAGINVMLFVDASGSVVFGKAVDLSARSEVPVPQSLLRHVAAGDPLLQHADANSSVTGVLLVPEGLMVVASRPILPSSGKGASRGTLVMARYLDASELQRLATITILSLTMRRFDDAQLPPDFLATRPLLSGEAPNAVRPLSEHTIAGYALLMDIYSEPSVMLRIDMPRDIYQQGQTTTLYFGLALLAAGVVFIVSLLLQLDKLVLSRLAKLGATVNRISVSGDLSGRVAAQGNDELTHLARAINEMLQALERSQISAKEATARYHQLFEEVQTGVLVVDATTRVIVDANAAAIRMLGAPKETIVGQPCRLFCSEQIGHCAQGDDGQISANSEGELFTANGEHMSVMRTTAGVMLEGRAHLLESVMDISERKRQERRLTHLAFHDPLTDVSNRRTLEDNLERVLADESRGIPSALLVLDVDRFKPVNDSLGHDAGDQVLVALTRVILQQLRSTDLLARLGGDEFAVLLERTTAENAGVIAERIRRRIEETTIVADEINQQLTVSIGVAAVDSHLTLREMMARADTAMYAAKQRGRNRTEVG